MIFRPIFIVGVGRSGTSLLQSLLNAHSRIAFSPETHFIRSYLTKKQSLEELKNQILHDQYLSNLKIDLEVIMTDTDNCKTLYKKILTEYLAIKQKDFIGDKDPKNIEYLKLINNSFPNALLVHIYRDPRAVISSRLKAKWSKDKPLWQHILAYKAQFNYMRKNQDIFGHNFIDIKYENLIKNPKLELGRILGKLDLKFEENMLDSYKNAGEIINKDELSWKDNLLKPIFHESVDNWRRALNYKTISNIEKSLYVEMNESGYDYDSKNSIILSTLYLVLSKIYCIKNCN